MLKVLDGAMGEELLKRSGRTGLWSAKALLDAPELVAEVHREYIAAGAQIITTNTYSTVPSYLAKAGLEHRYLELAQSAAQIARAEATPDVKVAGSLPPLDESYRPDLVPSQAVSRPIYESLVKVMAPYVDIWLCETMSSIEEAQNAASVACAQGEHPVYVAWTLDERPGVGLRSGESISSALTSLQNLEVGCVLFNCTSLDAIESALAEARSISSLPLGAYPNLFGVPPGWTLDNEVDVVRRNLTEEEFVAFAHRCHAAGAGIVGGCCGIGPSMIEALSRSIRDNEEKQT